jgi:hypothetical protein
MVEMSPGQFGQSDAGSILRNPADTIAYAMEFGFQPEIISGAEQLYNPGPPPSYGSGAVASAPLGNLNPAPSNLTFGSVTVGGASNNQLIATCSGGQNGVSYLVTWTATYLSGKTRALTGVVKCTTNIPPPPSS